MREGSGWLYFPERRELHSISPTYQEQAHAALEALERTGVRYGYSI